MSFASPEERRRIGWFLRATRLVVPAAVLVAALVSGALLSLVHWLEPELRWVPMVIVIGQGLSILALLLFGMRLRSRLLDPLVSLEQSVARVSSGEPGSRAALNDAGVLDSLAHDVGSLNDELAELYEDMDSRVARQTMRLAQKTASLKILYDCAATINQAAGLDDLLLRFLRVLKEMVNARAGTVRLVDTDGRRRLIGSIGLDDNLKSEASMGPVDLCLCGTALAPGDIVCRDDSRWCSRVYGREMFGSDEMELLTVPLEYHDHVFGAYTLFVDRPGLALREDIRELLLTIGNHLGVAVAKHRSDQEARRLSIVEERNAMAHELHDSLAQTLASLRMQFRLLDDTLKPQALAPQAQADLERIRNGVDEAHTELRGLLASFRAKPDRHGLIPSLQDLCERFGRESGIHTVCQNDCRAFELDAGAELQIVRIVQEALANVRKHARAQTVRVLLHRDPDGTYVVLVEDDGEGFALRDRDGHPGEHIGLSIMEERAKRLDGELRIESEPGEGTRVELRFHLTRARAA